jgi:hypothetical protein
VLSKKCFPRWNLISVIQPVASELLNKFNVLWHLKFRWVVSLLGYCAVYILLTNYSEVFTSVTRTMSNVTAHNCTVLLSRTGSWWVRQWQHCGMVWRKEWVSWGRKQGSIEYTWRHCVKLVCSECEGCNTTLGRDANLQQCSAASEQAELCYMPNLVVER